MILYWLGDAILLLVVLPIVVYLLRGVLSTAKGIVPSVERISAEGSEAGDICIGDLQLIAA